MNVLIISHRDPETLNLDAFVEIAQFVLQREEVPDNAEVSLAIIDNDEMASLNVQYRKKEGPTDVLSFPYDEPFELAGSEEPIILGDIVIAPDVAHENARALGTTTADELNLLIVHGVLHLLGYDHIDDDEAKVMQDREQMILKAWAING